MQPLNLPHHRRSIRIPGYDYTQAGVYFITIVTQGWKHRFGIIANQRVILNEIGKLAETEWKRLSDRFISVLLDAFIVMPNHIHGIIILVNEVGARGESLIPNPLDSPRAPTREKFGQPVSGSIPTIVRSYKSTVTQRYQILDNANIKPLWQRNYYEHIIRSEGEWAKIRDYIETNPLNWKNDQENR